MSALPRASRLALAASLLVGGAAGCGGGDPVVPGPDGGVVAAPYKVTLLVTLDGVPVEGAVVGQGGAAARVKSAADGTAQLTVDPAVPGDKYLIASHPAARIGGLDLAGAEAPYRIDLVRFRTDDNPDYQFDDPGVPSDNPPATTCSHCHRTLHADWWASPHRSAAKNPVLHDVYAGAAAAIAGEAECVAAGGAWRSGIGPGTGRPAARCYLGDGTLPDLNPSCRQTPCDAVASDTGGCADCHAPGIDGRLGGRGLLEATGRAYDFGVQCDVCHKVESIDLDKPPGVGGRLHLVRPSEKTGKKDIPFAPLSFGPFDDVVNGGMGSVQRAHFHDASLCAGCHQLEAAPRLPGAKLDATRWPGGTLPIHTTYAEWKAGPFSKVSCGGCHMPPAAGVMNSADLQHFLDTEGAVGGWRRPAGTTTHHAWAGPRQPQFRMLENAASLAIERGRTDGGDEVARVTVRNLGAGHALPTGEPLRSLILRVEARCGGEPVPAIGGDAIPDFGGALATKGAGEDWQRWPGARVGQVVRVVRTPGGHHDYRGFGPFGDGRFDAAKKGLPITLVAGQSTIRAVDGDRVTFDAPLPAGDLAWLGEEAPAGPGPSLPLAGAPGFAFARVLADERGRRMVPHHRAIDVAVDNRLLPGDGFTSEHRFAACGKRGGLTVRAVLLYRAYPVELARQRRWSGADTLMVEERR